MFASVRLDGSKEKNFSQGGSKTRFGSHKHTRRWSLTTKVKEQHICLGTLVSTVHLNLTPPAHSKPPPSFNTNMQNYFNKQGITIVAAYPLDWAVQHNPHVKQLHVILLFTAATVYSHSLITT